jgi:hypothetical protein
MPAFKELARTVALIGVLALQSGVALAQYPSRSGFGEPVKPIKEAQLPVAAGAPPRTIAEGTEVLVVSGYESAQQPTRVVVSRPGKQVLMVLTSYEKVLWKLDVDSKTTLKGVLLSSYDGSGGVISNAPAPLFAVKLPFATTTENVNYGGLLGLLGVARADVFRGSYTVPALVTIQELDAPRAELTLAGVAPTMPSKVFSFELFTSDFRKRSYRNTGPIFPDDEKEPLLSDSRRAVSASGDKIYKIGDGHSRLTVVDRSSGQAKPLPLPSNFPEFSWATGVAYDTQKHIVSVVTLGGEGFLYRYDVTREHWIDFRSLNNIDIKAFAYDPVGKRYVAWTEYGDLLSISSEGSLQSKKPQLAKQLKGFGRLYDGGNGSPPQVALAPRGPDIALAYIEGSAVSHIWSFDEKTGQVALTYKRGVPAKP